MLDTTSTVPLTLAGWVLLAALEESNPAEQLVQLPTRIFFLTYLNFSTEKRQEDSQKFKYSPWN